MFPRRFAGVGNRGHFERRLEGFATSTFTGFGLNLNFLTSPSWFDDLAKYPINPYPCLVP